MIFNLKLELLTSKETTGNRTDYVHGHEVTGLFRKKIEAEKEVKVCTLAGYVALSYINKIPYNLK